MNILFALLSSMAADAPPKDDEARAVIARAVKAQGGMELLTKQGASRGKVKGSYVVDNLEFTGEFHSHGPGKLRLTLDLKEQGTRLLVLNGTKGWLVFDGITQELDDATLVRMQKSNYVDRVSGLTTLLKDKGYRLALAGESKVDDKPAVVVKVSSDGQPDVSLHFDKETHLLVKAAHRGPDAANNQDALQESYYRDYRPAGTSARDEKLLTDAKRDVGGAALVTYLRQHVPDAATRAEIDKLIAQLGDESFNLRQRASSDLMKHGVKAAALMRQARTTSDIEVGRRLDKCLERLGPELAVAAATVRLTALRRPAEAIDALLAYLPWAPDDNVARDVQDALVTLAQAASSPPPALAKALDSKDVRLRDAAAAALGKDGGAYLKRPGRRLLLEGLRLPRVSALYTDGKKRLELETVEIEFFNRLDDSLFVMPQAGPMR